MPKVPFPHAAVRRGLARQQTHSHPLRPVFYRQERAKGSRVGLPGNGPLLTPPAGFQNSHQMGNMEKDPRLKDQRLFFPSIRLGWTMIYVQQGTRDYEDDK